LVALFAPSTDAVAEILPIEEVAPEKVAAVAAVASGPT